MRYRATSEPTDEWTAPYVSVFCDAGSHEEWKLYTFTWSTSAWGGGLFALARDYCDRDGRARRYTRARDFEPRQVIESDHAGSSRVVGRGEVPSDGALHSGWTLRCERCGLSVRARDETLQRALAQVCSVGESHISLSALGAIVRRNGASRD